jgi:hypothetical protein
MNKIIMRLLVLLGIASLTACGLPGAAARSVGTVGRTGESLGRTLSKLN